MEACHLTYYQTRTSDTIPPVLTILEPAQEEIHIDRRTLTISGTVQDNSAIKDVHVQIAGNHIIPLQKVSDVKENTLHFTYHVLKLQQGKNILTVMAVDQAGNRSEKVLSIYGQEDVFIQLTSDLPFTDVSKNDDGKRIETESDTLKITGTVKAPQGLQELRIKLREAEEKGARWSSIKRPFDEESRKELFFDETLQLDFGRNEVVLQAFDSTGKSAEYVLTAFRRSPEKSFDWQNLEEFFAQFCCGEMYGVIIGIEESQDQQFQVVFAANDRPGIV